MSVWAQWERHDQFERERALVRMRPAVVAAITPAFIGRVGSSAIFEAVDEALAQIVTAGGHLAEPEEVKALWIICARRRVIDEERSAESRHRGVVRSDGMGAEVGCYADPEPPTENTGQLWRIQEILGVLRGDQRRWAEAWFDEVLSAPRARGGQPRGLPDALGWTPAKTKCVSRRARKKMAAFIDDRTNGKVCDERRALLDAFIMSGGNLDDKSRYAVFIHLAGCEDCWAAWHARRRALLGRCRGVLVLPFDVAADAGSALSEKLAGLAAGVHLQASSLLARAGIGGVAAAGGATATIGGKVTAACVGVVCAATAGGELVGVLPRIQAEPAQEMRGIDERHERMRSVPAVIRAAAASAKPPAASGPAAPPPGSTIKAAVRRRVVAPRGSWSRATPGRAPSAGRTSFSPASATSGSPRPQTARPGAAFSPRPTGTSPRQSFCKRGSFGC